MYGDYFNIDESAFSIAPNPKYLFLSAQHQEVLAHLLYGITRSGGFVLITGEIGTGKTTVCRSLFSEIPENTDIALIVNPKLEPVDLLASICDELHITYPDVPLGTKTYLNKLNERLIESHAQGRNTILIIDEAQNLSVDALETIRGLTNLETDEQKLLQIILIGQPELRDRLNTHAMEQLNQRITARFHLEALDRDEVAAYIKHRLTIGKADANIFSKSNIDYIYKLTGGVPRLINVLCDRSLLGAYVQKKKKISNDIIYNAASESLGKRKQQNKKTPARFSSVGLALIAVIILIAITVGIVFYDHFAVERQLAAVENNQQKQVSSEIEPVQPPQAEQTNQIPEQAIILDSQSLADVDSQVITQDMATQSDTTEQQAMAHNNIDVTDSLSVAVDEEASDDEANAMDVDNNSDSHESEIVSQAAMQLTPKQQAYYELFNSWELEYVDHDVDPCVYAVRHELYCFTSQNGDVALLERLNRPAILKNKLPNGDTSYLFIKKITRGEVIVLDSAGEYRVSWDDIGHSWQGEFSLLWKPISEAEHIRPGQQGEFVKTIDEQLAIIFNRSPQWHVLESYDSKLVKEVKTFQTAQKISADGVIGPLTQIFMNNIVRSDVPKLR